jgi:hypothetical protein
MSPEITSSNFDLTLLPSAEYQFVVVSDTHYMLDQGNAPRTTSATYKSTPTTLGMRHLVKKRETLHERAPEVSL